MGRQGLQAGHPFPPPPPSLLPLPTEGVIKEGFSGRGLAETGGHSRGKAQRGENITHPVPAEHPGGGAKRQGGIAPARLMQRSSWQVPVVQHTCWCPWDLNWTGRPWASRYLGHTRGWEQTPGFCASKGCPAHGGRGWNPHCQFLSTAELAAPIQEGPTPPMWPLKSGSLSGLRSPI